MAFNPSQFYATLLSGQTCPVDLQHQIARHATSKKDAKLLSQLVARPDLDPALDEQFANSSNHLVLAAWVSRPERDPQHLIDVVKKDKRITVREAVASISDLPEEVYETLADVDNFKVAYALLTNPSVPSHVRVTAAGHLAANYPAKSGWDVSNKVSSVIRSGPDLVEALCANATRTSLVEMIVDKYDPPAESFGRIVDVLTDAVRNNSDGYWYVTDSIKALLKLAKVNTFPQDRVATVEAVLATYDAGVSSNYRGKTDNVKEFRDALRSQRDPESYGVSLMSHAREATGQDLVDLLAQAVSDASLCDALWLNEHLSIEQRREVAGHMTRRQFTVFEYTNPEIFGVMAANNMCRVTDNLLAHCTNPHESLKAALREAAAGRNYGHVPPEWLMSKYLTREAICDLPMFCFNSVIPAPVSVFVGELLVENFGTSEIHWAAFEGLAATVNGTLGHLIDVVNNAVDV